MKTAVCAALLFFCASAGQALTVSLSGSTAIEPGDTISLYVTIDEPITNPDYRLHVALFLDTTIMWLKPNGTFSPSMAAVASTLGSGTYRVLNLTMPSDPFVSTLRLQWYAAVLDTRFDAHSNLAGFVMGRTTGAMPVSSSAFADGSAMPIAYTKRGMNKSPGLEWQDAPAGTKSFAIVCLDTDADNFVHWMVYNLPVATPGIGEGQSTSANLPNGASQAPTGYGPTSTGYHGPYPPKGTTHHYVFTVYALDMVLPAGSISTLTQFQQLTASHILATGQITATYGY